MALTALVPLDGTKLSESAFALLPLLKALGFETVRLAGVWESAWDERDGGAADADLQEAEEKGRSFLSAYLDRQAERVRAAGLQPETRVRVGRPADELLDAAVGVDLVLIATHGRSGIARWWLGSVADEVVREAKCPVLVIGPNVPEASLSAFAVKRVLVPLDGSEQAEAALPLATWIADLTGAEIDIARCLSLTAVAYDPGMAVYSAELITSMEDAVKAYLSEVAGRLGGKVHAEMLIGAPGQQLLEYLDKRPADLVVMTSHGRTGVRRVALGSVADRMLHGPAPVLVFRATDSAGGLLAAARERGRA